MTDRFPVVLLHGLARGPWSLALLARRLDRAGFEVHNLSYPFRPHSLEQALEPIERQLAERGLVDAERLGWATYSLGGLLARAYLAAQRTEARDRLVMMAPPNQGTEIVDAIGHTRLFRLMFGELASSLGTRRDSLPRRLAIPTAEIGVIAGRRWINPLGRWLLRSEHDGTVTVESTRITGMADHLVVPHSHTLLMNSTMVASEVAHFLRHGRFHRTSDSRAA
ncbi:MAG: alpha/beta hydrolase [Acidobacteria bacterium]|nr:alpha/beta hydrolase [Acidobacteriota bacterium]